MAASEVKDLFLKCEASEEDATRLTNALASELKIVKIGHLATYFKRADPFKWFEGHNANPEWKDNGPLFCALDWALKSVEKWPRRKSRQKPNSKRRRRSQWTPRLTSL